MAGVRRAVCQGLSDLLPTNLAEFQRLVVSVNLGEQLIPFETGFFDLPRAQGYPDPAFGVVGQVKGIVTPPSPVIIPEMVVRIRMRKAYGQLRLQRLYHMRSILLNAPGIRTKKPPSTSGGGYHPRRSFGFGNCPAHRSVTPVTAQGTLAFSEARKPDPDCARVSPDARG